VLFNAEDEAIDKNLHQFKKDSAQIILAEFSKKNLRSNSQHILMNKIRGTGSIQQRYNSDRLKRACRPTAVNMAAVDELARSQRERQNYYR